MYKGGKKLLLIIGIVIGLAIYPILFSFFFYYTVIPQAKQVSADASLQPSTRNLVPDSEAPAEEGPLPYERGILTETTFESQWLGIRFNCPEDLYMETQEELDLGLTDEEGNLLDNTGFTNELGVYNETASFYLALTVEEPYAEDLTVKEYFDFLISDYSEEPGAYQFSDLTETREIGDLIFQKLSITSTDEGGIPFHNDYYITCKDGKFIVISSYYSDDAAHCNEEALNAFLPY